MNNVRLSMAFRAKSACSHVGLLTAPDQAMSAAPGGGRRTSSILEEGGTCWRIAPADRPALLSDAAAHYLALLQAFRQARGRIMILGWDLDPGVRLDPAEPLDLDDLGRMLCHGLLDWRWPASVALAARGCTRASAMIGCVRSSISRGGGA